MNTLVRENRTNGERQTTEQFIAPAATVFETTDGYTLEVEMPGVSKENLEMWVENNELTILGRRSTPSVEGTLLHRESRSENFRRSFELDPSIDAGKNQREDRAGRRHLDSAQGGASQAAQDRRSVSEPIFG